MRIFSVLLSTSRIIGWELHPRFGLEERVGQGDLVGVLEERIFHIIRVYIEEHGHINLKHEKYIHYWTLKNISKIFQFRPD